MRKKIYSTLIGLMMQQKILWTTLEVTRLDIQQPLG